MSTISSGHEKGEMRKENLYVFRDRHKATSLHARSKHQRLHWPQQYEALRLRSRLTTPETPCPTQLRISITKSSLFPEVSQEGRTSAHCTLP